MLLVLHATFLPTRTRSIIWLYSKYIGRAVLTRKSDDWKIDANCQAICFICNTQKMITIAGAPNAIRRLPPFFSLFSNRSISSRSHSLRAQPSFALHISTTNFVSDGFKCVHMLRPEPAPNANFFRQMVMQTDICIAFVLILLRLLSTPFDVHW